MTTKNYPSVTLKPSVEASEEHKTTDEGGRTMSECGTDLGDEMEGPMNAAHSHVDIGEMDSLKLHRELLQKIWLGVQQLKIPCHCR